MQDRSNNEMADFSHWLSMPNMPSHLGRMYERDIYAVRPSAESAIRFPFARDHFTAFVQTNASVTETAMRRTALELLEHGMRSAVCQGTQADRMSEIFDELIDQHGFNHQGGTVYSQVQDDDLAEALEYFILPEGLADIGLIVILGNDDEAGDVEDAIRFVIEGAAACELEALCC